MSDYEIKSYEPEHFHLLEFDQSLFKTLMSGKSLEDLGNLYRGRGPAFTGFYKRKPIVIAGINILWPAHGEAWAFLGGNYREHGLFIQRNAIKYLEQIVREYKLKRVQAVAEKNHAAAVKWLESMGFKYEGEMEKYYDNKTFLRYAKIFPEI